MYLLEVYGQYLFVICRALLFVFSSRKIWRHSFHNYNYDPIAKQDVFRIPMFLDKAVFLNIFTTFLKGHTVF